MLNASASPHFDAITLQSQNKISLSKFDQKKVILHISKLILQTWNYHKHLKEIKSKDL